MMLEVFADKWKIQDLFQIIPNNQSDEGTSFRLRRMVERFCAQIIIQPYRGFDIECIYMVIQQIVQFLMYFLLTFTVFIATGIASCPNPPPAAQFTIEKYQGLWYQIAKYQTAGGAYFEKDCKCTKINVFRTNGEIKAYQSCEKSGKLSAVNATLIPTDPPGRFAQKISLNKVGYWVIQLDNQSAIEFDCSETAGLRNYCIHIMSKKKTLSPQKLKALSDYALGLGLNPNNLPMTITDQVNCVYSEKNLLEN